MNEIEIHQFQDAYSKFEAGDRAEALRELRDLSRKLDDPWGKAALLYHEALFLLEMNEISEARQRLEEFKSALASLGEPPPDGYQDDLPHNLAVMVRYTELRVLFQEQRDTQALQVLDDLASRYPKQLSIPGFHEILNDVNLLHGFLLANAGRWGQAKPFLESALPSEGWKSLACYYLGRCYYEFREYKNARGKLVEALDLGLGDAWQGAAHYVLGIVEYHLSDMGASKREFDLCVKTADPAYLSKTKIWEWLEATSRALGQYDEAEKYQKRKDSYAPPVKPN